jgi:tetratricopeptide (TPR) repeat protein
MAIAAAAIIAAPPAVGQPMQLTPPTQQAEPQAPSAAASIPTPAPAEAPAVEAPPAPLRGPVTLPPDLTVAASPSAPPPAPPPSPPPAPAPTSTATAPPAPPPPRFDPAPNATVSVGVQENYTRLSFNFVGPTTVTPLLQGNRLELRFSRAADMDLADIRANLPRNVREVRRTSAAGAPVRLVLTLDYGVRQRHFIDGNRVVLDLLTPETPAQTASTAPATPGAPAASAPAPARPPVNGVGQVRLVEEANATRVTVTWPAPARAAAFRRGEAIWLLFDATGRMDLTGVARAGRRHSNIEVVQGEGVIGLRIPAQPDVQVSASASDASWTFTLGARADNNAAATLTREIAPDGRGRITAAFGREGVVRWVRDPEIGDRIAVALLGGPARGVDSRRATMEAAILPAAHGAVVEARADDVNVAFEGGVLNVTRGAGLIAATAPNGAADELSAAMMTADMDDPSGAAQPNLDLVQVRARIDQLTRAAAEEGVQEGAGVEARLELARFLLQNDYAAEALGALRIASINQGELVELDPEFRLMRGAANVMMGRAGAAMNDLTASALNSNPSAALWRGYAASLRKDWAEARREFERGAGALEEHPPAWRARFQLALAQAAFELNDYAPAETAARTAMGQSPDQSMRLQARVIEARVTAARGDTDRALTMLDELARARDEGVAVSAAVEAIRIRRMTGVMRAVDAIEPLEALRFRWRGDATELAVVGMLGEAYSEQGRWREALATMRVAADRFPTDPAARVLRADMTNLFERLFLDGEADQLEPIQALGLFYEFSDLTPVGPNGDRIVRLLAGRLVHVDLLEQAAQLLQYQVDERLHGPSKAQVGADLAAIYLMDRKPDRALVALGASRQPNMPANLLGDRRILEARALLDLGRLDAAVELVERDRGEEAQRVRAEAAWRARDWERAAVELRAVLAARGRAQPLDAHGRQVVLRAAVALTLAHNEDGVRALYREYAGDMASTPEADAFEVVASGVTADGAAIRDVARAVARTDLLDRFMQRLRTNMTAEAAAHAANAPTAPAPPGQPAPTAPPQAALPAPATRPTAPAAGA